MLASLILSYLLRLVPFVARSIYSSTVDKIGSVPDLTYCLYNVHASRITNSLVPAG